MSPHEDAQNLAFNKIQQAIREEDLWLAAWLMARFINKHEYQLMPSQLTWLNGELSQRRREVQNTCLALEERAQRDARDDFHKWFSTGLMFREISDRSWDNHTYGFELWRLRTKLAVYSRAAGYLQEIILMATRKRDRKSGVSLELELEAMGCAPSTHSIQA
ncbi:hypothetical protein PCASD_25236 [Puccinia coronata f. sp. avenae]|uniref:Uncharacterized protein n=1 Tax=Puccinia coronata f. sp. avenae TaxID=200324 RepID=A0A2N5SEE7_9BASI|nr:hypothetical protein PCASD_25236 [Puccinia coronata f. sp. avenae]